jgi:Putative lumazine-binding
MTISSNQGRLLIASLASAAALSGCGETVATNNFQGEQHEVASRISSFQKHVQEASQKELCAKDLAATLIARLRTSGKGCTEVLKEQLKNVEDPSLSIKTVTVHGKTASATVKSVRYGKTVPETLTLVKEGNGWKISGI